jgi:hypothetical protein
LFPLLSQEFSQAIAITKNSNYYPLFPLLSQEFSQSIALAEESESLDGSDSSEPLPEKTAVIRKVSSSGVDMGTNLNNLRECSKVIMIFVWLVRHGHELEQSEGVQ